MKTLNYRHIAIIALLFMALTALAQDNDKILNRQYADMKKVHYGFSVGAESFKNRASGKNCIQ